MEIKTIPYIGDSFQDRNGHFSPRESWLYSPSGRYAVYLSHPVLCLPVFLVMNVEKGWWTQYRSLCGPLRKTCALYWLHDNCVILVDHERNQVLTQNLIYLDHEKKTVDCTMARNYEWDSVDSVYNSNCDHPLQIDNKEYFVAVAFKPNDEPDLFRLFPWNPLQEMGAGYLEYSVDPDNIAQAFDPDLVATSVFVCGSKVYIVTDCEARFYVSQYVCIDMQMVVSENAETISAETPGVRLINYPKPFAPHRKVYSRMDAYAMYNIYQIGPEVVYSFRNYIPRRSGPAAPNRCLIHVVDLEAGTTTTTMAGLAASDFLALDRFGTLSVWMPDRDQSLRTRRLTLPKYSPMSLFNICCQKILNEWFGNQLDLPEFSIIFK